MYTDFLNFCEYFVNDRPQIELCDLEDYKQYFNAYNSFMVSKKMSLNDIKKYRMNSIIDYYMDIHKNQQNTQPRNVYLEIYQNNIRDQFNKTLNPPVNPFFLEERERKEAEEKQRKEDENDDIKDHYRYLELKYKYFADLVYRMNHPQEFEDDYSNSDYRIDENTDSDSMSFTDEYYDDESYNEEVYDEYDDDYYSDEEY